MRTIDITFNGLTEESMCDIIETYSQKMHVAYSSVLGVEHTDGVKVKIRLVLLDTVDVQKMSYTLTKLKKEKEE